MTSGTYQMRQERVASPYENGNWLYYACLWLYFATGAIGDSMLSQSHAISQLARLGTLACIPLFAVRLLALRRFRLESMASFSVFVAVAAVVYLKTSSRLPLFIVLTLYGAEGADSRKVGLVYLSSTGAVVLASTLLALAGVIEDRIFIADYGRSIRHSFGMNYVTIWAAYVFFICAAFLYIRRERITWRTWVPLVLLSYALQHYCRARLEAVMLLVLLLLLTFEWALSHSRVYKVVTSLSFPISAALVYVVQRLYMRNPVSFSGLDKVLSYRLRETAKVLSLYHIGPFGQTIRMQGYGTVNYDTMFGYFFVDSFYINFALRYGYVILIGIMVISVLVLAFLHREGRCKEATFLSIAWFHGVIISSVLSPYMNPLFLMAFADYSRDRQAMAFGDMEEAPSIPNPAPAHEFAYLSYEEEP